MKSKFTLMEVVISLAILTLSLAGMLQLVTNSQQRIADAGEKWKLNHLLMQAAEYILLEEDEEKTAIPQEIFNYPGYSALVSYNEVEDLPETLINLDGQIPLRGCKIEILSDQDNRTLTEITVDRFSYQNAENSASINLGGRQ